MSVFTSESLKLKPGSLIVARVSAANEHGSGPYSPVNASGATVKGVPGQLPNIKVATSVDSVQLTWDAAPTAEYYEVEYKQGSTDVKFIKRT